MTEGTQEPGTVCPVLYVLKDDGGEMVETTGGMIEAKRLRRDRRGVKLPVYGEVAREGA